MLIADGLVVMKYLGSIGKLATPKVASQWMRELSQPDYVQFRNAGDRNVIYCGTVGEADILCLPAGALFFEKIGPRDYVGIRCGAMYPNTGESLDSFRHRLRLVGTPSATLDDLIDELALVED